MFAAKRVVSFCSDDAATLPLGSQRLSFGVEVDTDDAVPRAARVVLNFVEHSILLPFAGLIHGILGASDLDDVRNGRNMDYPNPSASYARIARTIGTRARPGAHRIPFNLPPVRGPSGPRTIRTNHLLRYESTECD